MTRPEPLSLDHLRSRRSRRWLRTRPWQEPALAARGPCFAMLTRRRGSPAASRACSGIGPRFHNRIDCRTMTSTHAETQSTLPKTPRSMLDGFLVDVSSRDGVLIRRSIRSSAASARPMSIRQPYASAQTHCPSKDARRGAQIGRYGMAVDRLADQFKTHHRNLLRR